MNLEQLQAAATERHHAAEDYARNVRLARLARTPNAPASPRLPRLWFAREICMGPLCVRFILRGA